MATKAELPIDLPVPAAEAFDATYRALASLGFSVAHADPAVGLISAKSSLDLMSWGENLELYVQPTTATTSTVIIRSALKFGLVDWGKNKKNVTKIGDAIRAQLGTFPGAVAGAQPAGWHPDPSGRHHHRWWDGQRWTDAVSTDGTTSTDPVPQA
jgi:uncharacterized protein (DUF1499 family)